VLAKPYDVGDLVAQTAAFLRATRRRGNVKARVRDHALRCFDVRMMTMAYGKVYARAQQRFAVAARKEPYVISPIAATKDFADASCGAGAPFSVVREGVSAQEAVLAVAYEVYARARSGSGATLLAEKMMADNAPSVELEYLLGDAMRMGGRAADALAWFMKMYRKNPRELSLLIGAGESLRDMERHAEAKACAAAALKAAPHDERIRAFARTLSVI
jgi:tetratricopeptide (TPR) repeat protein